MSRKFRVTYREWGRHTVEIEADDEEDAKDKVESFDFDDAGIEDVMDAGGVEVEDVEDINDE